MDREATPGHPRWQGEDTRSIAWHVRSIARSSENWIEQESGRSTKPSMPAHGCRLGVLATYSAIDDFDQVCPQLKPPPAVAHPRERHGQWLPGESIRPAVPVDAEHPRRERDGRKPLSCWALQVSGDGAWCPSGMAELKSVNEVRKSLWTIGSAPTFHRSEDDLTVIYSQLRSTAQAFLKTMNLGTVERCLHLPLVRNPLASSLSRASRAAKLSQIGQTTRPIL